MVPAMVAILIRGRVAEKDVWVIRKSRDRYLPLLDKAIARPWPFILAGMLTYFRDLPKAYGFGLPVVYLVWLLVVAGLYPVCRRYATLKARSRAWWLSYL